MNSALTFPAIVFLAALASVVVAASWFDIGQRRIPNWLCAINLGLGLAYAGFSYGGISDAWVGIGLAALHVVAALLVTMGLFGLRMIGAGDAKFYASMAAWLPIGLGLNLLVAVAVAGFLLLVAFFLFRIRGRATRAREANSPFDKLPYGVAIGIGGFVAVIIA